MRTSTLVVLGLGIAAGLSSAAVGQVGGLATDPRTGEQYEAPPDPSCRLIMSEPRRWRCPSRVIRAMRQPAEPGVTGAIGSAAPAGTVPAGAVRDPRTGELYASPPDPSCRLIMSDPRRWRCPARVVRGMTQ